MKNENNDILSTYQTWINAQYSAESGDMYDDILIAYWQIIDGLEYGKTGTNKYKSALDLLLPEGEEINTYIKTLDRYLQNPEYATGVFNFLNDLIDQGLMNTDFELTAYTTIEDIADALTLTPEMVIAILGELEEYNISFEYKTYYDSAEQKNE